MDRDHWLSRRDLLRVGAVGLAAAAVPLPAAFGKPSDKAPARSVIVVYLAGGLTHIDSFDPKPDAPEEVRGTLTAIGTSLPGVRFCETLPLLAKLAHRLTVLRSFSHDSNDHFVSQARVLSGRMVGMANVTTEPNVGSVVAKMMGPRAGFPGYIAVPGTTRPGPPPKNLFTGGWLGQEFAPFSSGGSPRDEDFTAKVAEAAEEDFNQQGLQLPAGIDLDRLAGRQALHERLDAALKQMEASPDEVLGRQQNGAFQMLLRPEVRRAFDLRRETDAVRESYGKTKIGQRCLLARRLAEAGARFVMVDYGYDPEYGNLWDNHRAAVQNQPHICEMVKLPYHVAGVDRALAGLLKDLDARGLLAETLVVLLTEFGRTPKINKEGGRDHWGAAGSLVFAGGGVREGQVIGATDRIAAQPTTNSYTPADVAATIYHALGVETETVLSDRLGRPLPMLPEGAVIPGVF
jgi:hypothetical protein